MFWLVEEVAEDLKVESGTAFEFCVPRAHTHTNQTQRQTRTSSRTLHRVVAHSHRDTHTRTHTDRRRHTKHTDMMRTGGFRGEELDVALLKRK